MSDQIQPEAQEMQRRMKALLHLVEEEHRACKLCGVELSMVRHRNGKVAPYTQSGLNHFLDCPYAERFRRRAKETQNV